MARIAASFDELIGRTPLLELGRLARRLGLGVRLLAKLESFNPAGSVKDRVARAILDDAERSGRLKPGAVIVEPTSGNTGVGLAAVAAVRGFRAVIVMPETMSVERRRLMAAYGAEVVLSEGSRGMAGAIAKAEEIAAATENAILAGQFVNEANPRAHFETTGPEIWEDTDGAVDVFVAGVGTGGTITGVGRFLKSRKPDARIVAVEPASSPVLSGGAPGTHKIQGIGAGFVPRIMDAGVCDEIVAVTNDDAMSMARELARREGVLAGVSSGAALKAAADVAKRPENEGRTVVVLLPDTGERYLSTELFAES